jgi:hypothetical protein
MALLIAAQHSFLDAVDLNNEAVSMIIAAGDTNNQKAIQLLERSVSIMEKTSAAVQQCSGQAHTNTPLASSAAPIIHHHHHETLPLPHTFPDQRWFMYNKALRFSTEIVSLASFLEDFHVFSAVVVFNLALIYHRSALCGNQKFASLSGKASSLYSLVLKLVDWPGWISSRTSIVTCTIVKLAATNNLAQISSESGDTKLAHDFLQHLSAGIRRSRTFTPGLFQSSGDMYELMINLFFWQPDTAVAPAA